MSIRLFATAFLASLPVLASSPSEPCREGAVLCREAFLALEKCEQSRSAEASEDTCAAARAETERVCMQTTGICHTDGSRAAPAKTVVP